MWLQWEAWTDQLTPGPGKRPLIHISAQGAEQNGGAMMAQGQGASRAGLGPSAALKTCSWSKHTKQSHALRLYDS